MRRVVGIAAALFAGIFGAAADRLIAGDVVVIQLHDGSRRAGEINEQTDDERLWLHTVDSSTVVLSSMAWNRIAAADIGGETMTAKELAVMAERVKSEIPPIIVEPLPMRIRPLQPRIQSLEILPWLGNWDGDAAMDGVQVRLEPLDQEGEIVPVNGLATIRVYARRNARPERLEYPAQFGFWTDDGSVREYAVEPRPERYFELGCWTRRVRSQDFDRLGVTLKLPFQSFDPERDLGVDLEALAEATLRVNGHEIYRATAPMQLRRFNPFREGLQLHRGQRFLPGE